MTDQMDTQGHGDRTPTTILVNKKPVELNGPRVTGAEVKSAAIAQGVTIQSDFQLSRKQGKTWEIIGDDELVTVNKNSEFTAIDGDDNS